MTSTTVVWLTPAKNKFEIDASERLAQIEIDCIWVHSIESIKDTLEEARPLAIFVSDTPDDELSPTFLTDLGGIDVARKARWVLLYHHERKSLFRLAASCQFRDCIPMELDAKTWIERLLFASSGSGQLPNLHPTRIHLGESSDIILPAKLVWITEKELRIEGYTSPAQSSELILAGGIMKKAFGQAITVIVKKVEREKLNYRFSNAIEGSWKVPGFSNDEAFAKLKSTRQPTNFVRQRIYVVVRQKGIRDHIITGFSNKSFDIQYALQTKSIAKEPSFYSPELMFIDTSLFRNADQMEHLHECLRTLPKVTTVILVGGFIAKEALKEHKSLIESKKIVFLTLLTQEKIKALKQEHPIKSQSKNQNREQIYLERSDEFSCIYIKTFAQMIDLNTQAISLEFEFPVRKYAIMEITSPSLTKWIGSTATIKVLTLERVRSNRASKTTGGINSKFIASCFFCNLNAQKSHQLATGLHQFFASILGIPTISQTDSEPKKEAPEIIPSALPEIDEDPLKDIEIQTQEKKQRLKRRIRVVPHDEPYKYSYKSKNNALAKSFRPPSVDFSILKNLLIIALIVFIVSMSVRAIIPNLRSQFKKSGEPYTKSLFRFMGRTPPKSNDNSEQ